MWWRQDRTRILDWLRPSAVGAVVFVPLEGRYFWDGFFSLTEFDGAGIWYDSILRSNPIGSNPVILLTVMFGLSVAIASGVWRLVHRGRLSRFFTMLFLARIRRSNSCDGEVPTRLQRQKDTDSWLARADALYRLPRLQANGFPNPGPSLLGASLACRWSVHLSRYLRSQRMTGDQRSPLSITIHRPAMLPGWHRNLGHQARTTTTKENFLYSATPILRVF